MFGIIVRVAAAAYLMHDVPKLFRMGFNLRSCKKVIERIHEELPGANLLNPVELVNSNRLFDQFNVFNRRFREDHNRLLLCRLIPALRLEIKDVEGFSNDTIASLENLEFHGRQFMHCAFEFVRFQEKGIETKQDFSDFTDAVNGLGESFFYLRAHHPEHPYLKTMDFDEEKIQQMREEQVRVNQLFEQVVAAR